MKHTSNSKEFKLEQNSKSFTVAIVGSRRIGHNRNFVLKSLADFFSENKPTLIISGGAWGVDTIAERSAEALNIDTLIILPDNPKIKYSYIQRNKTIVDKADFVLIYWNGESKGSESVITYCKAINKPYRLILMPT